MPAQVRDLLTFLRRLAPGSRPGDGDGVILSRYLQGDHDAFAVLVARYAPLVWGVCRRVLDDHHEAEDAFQAVFIVLAHKARSLSAGPLGPWLSKVARDAALKAKRRLARRRSSQIPTQTVSAVYDAPELEQRERDAAIDEELDRLPERLRRPVILCYVEGLTTEEAASQLGCPRGTVLSRLSRARERLRQRLAHRGIDLTPGVSLAAILQHPSPALVEAAGRAGQLLWGSEAGLFSTPTISLAKKVMFGMFMRKLRVAGMVLLLAGLVATGANWLTSRAAEPGAGVALQTAKAAAPRNEPRGNTDVKEEEAVTPGHLIYRVTTDLQRSLAGDLGNIFALVDGTSVVKDGKVFPEALKLKELREDLRKHKKAGDKVCITLFYNRDYLKNGPGRDLLLYTMKGVGYDVGFSKVVARETLTASNITWANHINTFRKKGVRRADLPEPATGNKFVKVYPVRTELSDLLTGGADCVVTVLQPLDKPTIPEEVRKATIELLGKLKLARKQRVNFRIQVIEGGIDGQLLPQPLANEFFSFAKKLGFADSSVSTR